jgi:hypothetical protein
MAADEAKKTLDALLIVSVDALCRVWSKVEERAVAVVGDAM